MADLEILQLLGQENVTYGGWAWESLGPGRATGAISVGASPHVPSAALKRDFNEDALAAIDAGDACLLVVADAHWGAMASHELIGAAVDHLRVPFEDLDALVGALGDLAAPEGDAGDPSESTLVLAQYARGSRLGFGLSFGDSSLVILDSQGTRCLTEKTSAFVSPSKPETLASHRAQRFAFRAQPGGLVLAFTDGVDECHYGRPETSIGLGHLEALFQEVGPQPEAYARRLVELALAGVDGNPGGEDNIALVVAAT